MTCLLQASVAVAMGLIKGLLVMGKAAAEGAADALCLRFSQEDIIAAFGHLIKQGHLYSGQYHRPFHLSKRFHASLQVRKETLLCGSFLSAAVYWRLLLHTAWSMVMLYDCLLGNLVCKASFSKAALDALALARVVAKRKSK